MQQRNSPPAAGFGGTWGRGDKVRAEPRTGSRRVSGALLLAGLLSMAVALAPAGSEAKRRPPARQKRPNIVMIMDDDQSAEQQRFLTKTNAAISQHGVTFDNSF